MIKAVLLNGEAIFLTPEIVKEGKTVRVTIPKSLDTGNIKHIELDTLETIAKAGDKGYMLIPNEGMLCTFKEQADCEYVAEKYAMPVYGVKTENECFVAIVTGMAYNYHLVCGVKNGEYYLYPRFLINGEDMYEDISVTFHYLEGDDADYSGMARCYRNYQISRGECVPLEERMANRPLLKYASQSVMIRIRNGWKPCPPQIMEQTLENEPEMHVATDFERVGKILDELKNQGVEKAEICLVGWNAKGHDGRWPQPFPVAEELGGETALRALIKKAQDMGYQIVCHTNSTDTYTVSDMWNKDDLILDRNGNPPKEEPWSGGQMYQICPQIALEQAKEILPKVADLGFRGIHYIDVLNIVMPRVCSNPKHPLNMGKAIEIDRELMKLASDLFGGYSSEGGYDFGAKYLDFALNCNYYGKACPNPLCDEKVPFWQLVYHGIILSNPGMSRALNFSCHKEKTADMLKVVEHGGRPTFYYNVCFTKDWRNNRGEDLICDTDEMLVKSVSQIKEGAELNKLMAPLQTAFMEKHEKLSDGLYRVTYSNGTVITVDYNKGEYTVN